MKSQNLLLTAGLLLVLLIFSCKSHKRQATDDGNMILGNPTNAIHNDSSPNNYLIDHKYFIESYNKSTAEPNWVSWHLCMADLGSIDRTNNFRADTTGLPKGWYEADKDSYRKSGFDKGHNCPSGDRTNSSDANSETFLMDNIIPQAANNNRRTWEHLEKYCREQVLKGEEAFIIMGSYGNGGYGRLGFKTKIADDQINVPAHIWKIIILIPDGDDDLERIASDAEVIAVDTPNSNSISSHWQDYICTVRDIENATGDVFFSNLPGSVKSEFEYRKFEAGR